MNPEEIPLRDLHLPPPVGFWPLAPGWWILLAVIVAALAYGLYKLYRRWRWNAVRRLALAELQRIRNDYQNGVDALTVGKALSELMRRSMLAYAPRREVAGLTGDAWLQWLDQGLDDAPFTKGAGRLLETLPYRRQIDEGEDTQIRALLDVVRERIRTPLVQQTSPEGAG